MAAVLDEVGVERAFVHGTSTGGMIAIKLAAKYPEKVRALILGATATKLDFVGRSQFLVRKGAGSRVRDRRRRARARSSDCGAFAQRARRARRRGGLARAGDAREDDLGRELVRRLRRDDRGRLTGDLPKIGVPTPVMAGELDTNTPIDAGPQGARMRLHRRRDSERGALRHSRLWSHESRRGT